MFWTPGNCLATCFLSIDRPPHFSRRERYPCRCPRPDFCTLWPPRTPSSPPPGSDRDAGQNAPRERGVAVLARLVFPTTGGVWPCSAAAGIRAEILKRSGGTINGCRGGLSLA
eukprot:9355465-Pyramimonas_sp.AAC.1